LILNKIPNVFTKVFLVTVILAAVFIVAPGVSAEDDTPTFRIIAVSEHDGQLLVEVEHFKANGSFDYFENYLWQGREGTRHPIVVNTDGQSLLATGQIAPYTERGFQYLPDRQQWKREAGIHLGNDSILSVIQYIHNQRRTWAVEDWPHGRKLGQSRLIERPIPAKANDIRGINTLLTKFAGLVGTAYLADESGTLMAYEGTLPAINSGLGLVEYGTVSTFYSGAGDSVDGEASHNQTTSWATVRAGAGNSSSYTANVNLVGEVKGTSPNWEAINRLFALYDTSALPDGDTIDSAVNNYTGSSTPDFNNDFAESASLTSSNPASNTAIANSDYGTLGTTLFAASILFSNIVHDDATVTVFTLNAAGLAAIDATGTTKFGIRTLSDLSDSEPSGATNDMSRVWFHMEEETVPGDRRPNLVITHTTPPAAVITGTVGDGATEQEVRDGGGTIIVTLTGETWVADGATFDAQRQAIIDGLDAASSPTTGWNNEVRDSIGVSSVARTSSTEATITLTASEVAGYAIASDETITMTVPAAALTGGVALTATPTITITAALESAAITGTIGDGATEQEVRDGGGTILITLSNTTWVAAAGSVFDNQRQNIIDGLVAADSQTYGWNNEVKAKLGVGAVVRTSDTLVTITIPAGDVEDYRIVTNEVITTTVPATAMVFGAALVATPTTTITGTVESAAVSGTLGGSGGTAAEIEAGGETVIITLTNTTWVTAGATFNAQRQNILDGLVADDSDVNGWNAMAFAVGDVARTDATTVTITLSAESAYAIPSAETVTTTVPTSAIVYGAALVAPETFTISPAAFATAGTRVSTAIDLQSITNLAYCAIGWETTLPTNTAVAIETSINGGSTYSTATNGSCPTGLTLGESLATITDFRVKATLTTTDTSATPLITALGLIVEDAGGSELCYQLVTTPSATLADSCGIYNGTMSFPIGPSTITSITDPITSTADPLPNARALAGQDVAQAVTGSATSASLFPAAGDEGGFVGLPLNDLVNEMSTVGDGLPVRFVWFIFLGIATIGAGMMAIHLTSNLFIAAGAMAAVMGFQMAIGSTGLLPGWILFAFIPLAAAFLLFRRGFPV
jgi:hypothetical protein